MQLGRFAHSHFRSASSRPIPKIRRNSESSAFPDAHIFQAIVPSLDDHSLTKREFERATTAHRAVENFSIRSRPASVVHRELITSSALSGTPIFHLSQNSNPELVEGSGLGQSCEHCELILSLALNLVICFEVRLGFFVFFWIREG